MSAVNFIVANWGYIATFLWALGEILSQIPWLTGNSAITFIISAAQGKMVAPAGTQLPPPPPAK